MCIDVGRMASCASCAFLDFFVKLASEINQAYSYPVYFFMLGQDKENMNDYKLTKQQISELEKFHRKLKDKRQADRVKAIVALAKGWSAANIAEILLFDEKTTRTYFQTTKIMYFVDRKFPSSRCWLIGNFHLASV